MSSFSAPQVVLKKSMPIPSPPGALFPPPLFTASCSSSVVNGISSLPFQFSDKRQCPAPAMRLTQSSSTCIGPYFCFIHALKVSIISFIDVCIPPLGSFTWGILRCSRLIRLLIRWNKDICSSWNISGVCVSIVPDGKSRAVQFNQFWFRKVHFSRPHRLVCVVL